MSNDDLLLAAVAATAAAIGLEILTMPMGANLRLDTIAQAREFARSVNKPVLNVGCCGIGIGGLPQQDPRVRSAGDVNVDMRHEAVEIIDGAVHMPGDINHLPFPDRSFGAAIASHILEHLDAVAALRDPVEHGLSGLLEETLFQSRVQAGDDGHLDPRRDWVNLPTRVAVPRGLLMNFVIEDIAALVESAPERGFVICKGPRGYSRLRARRGHLLRTRTLLRRGRS